MTTSSQVVEAPAAEFVGSAHLVQEIPLERLQESARNPRRTVNQADLEELAASIREIGITVPLLVRPGWSKIDKPGDYEIVCGHRRFMAAVMAKLKTAPCIVRHLTDEEAADIALIDNLQRVDVPALEEAEAFGELLDRLHSITAVAAKVGKEQGYVAKRLKLRTLTECARQALAEQLITIDHALLLARLAADEQDEALKWCLDTQAGSRKPVDEVIAERLERRREAAQIDENPEERRWRSKWEPQTVQQLKEHIAQESGTILDRAPWSLDDAGLVPDAGACSGCPKNTKANIPLFGDLEIGEPICTDGVCFKEKTAAFVRIQSRVSEGTQTPLRVSWKSTSTAPRQEKAGGGIALNQTFKYGQWIDIGKKGAKCEHQAAAVTVDWSDANDRRYMGGSGELRKPGEILQVCIQPKCKVHKKSYEGQSRSNGAGGRVDPAEQKRREEEKKQLEAAESKVRSQVFTAILKKLDVGTSLRLVTDRYSGAAQWRQEVLKLDLKMPAERLEALTVFCCVFAGRIEANGYFLVQKNGVANDRKELWGLAKAVGVNADEHAAAALPLTLPATVHDALYPASMRKQLKKAAPAAAGAKKAPAKKPAKLPAKKAAKKAGRK